MDVEPSTTSLACLAILARHAGSYLERENAFRRLLSLPDGWWGACALVVFVQAAALRAARARLGRGNEHQLDWEGAADQALVTLFEDADTIGDDPRRWLWDTIDCLVAQQTPCRTIGNSSPADEPERSTTAWPPLTK